MHRDDFGNRSIAICLSTSLSFLKFIEYSEQTSYVLITNPVIYKSLDVNVFSNFDRVFEVSNQYHKYFMPLNYVELNHAAKEAINLYPNIKFITYNESNTHNMFRLNEELALKRYNFDYRVFTDKLTFLSKLSESLLIKRKHYYLNNSFMMLTFSEQYEVLRQNLGEPFIIKPRDCAGCYGVRIVKHFDQYKDFAREDYIAEQFINGDVYHSDIIVHNREYTLLVSKYHEPPINCHKGRGLGSKVIFHDDSSYILIDAYIQNLLEKIEFSDGVYHLEFIIGDDFDIELIEMAARPGGAKIVEMYLEAFEINLINELVRLNHNNYSLPRTRKNLYSAWYCSATPEPSGKLNFSESDIFTAPNQKLVEQWIDSKFLTESELSE